MCHIKKKLWPLDAKAVSNLIIVLVGILFYVLLMNFTAVRARISMFFDVIMPFIAGFAVAYLLNTPVHFFEEKVYRKLRFKRGLSIATVYFLVAVVLSVLINMILPQVIESIIALINNIQVYLTNFNALVDHLVARFDLEGEGIDALMLSYEDLIKRVANSVSAAIPKLFDLGVAVGNIVISAITALISSIYMLSGRNKLKIQIKSIMFALFPCEKVERVLAVSRRANDIFVGFINGKIIDSLIIGVLCFVLCSIFRIPLALLISLVVGITNIIPFFGPFIGAIPSIMILLIVDPWASLRFTVLVIALQQFDGNILGPKILGDSTGISAIWVLVAIVVGGGLFGFAGMLLGVPTFAVLYMLTKEYVGNRLAEKNIDGEGRPLKPLDDSAESEI